MASQASNQEFNNTIDAIMSDSGNPNDPISISSSPSSSSPPTSSKTVFPNRRGPQTLQDLASRSILDNLRSSLEGYQATANYCLGGSIPSIYPLGKKEGREEHWGVKAELYKLNVGEGLLATRGEMCIDDAMM
jgi:hypothetical protein